MLDMRPESQTTLWTFSNQKEDQDTLYTIWFKVALVICVSLPNKFVNSINYL